MRQFDAMYGRKRSKASLTTMRLVRVDIKMLRIHRWVKGEKNKIEEEAGSWEKWNPNSEGWQRHTAPQKEKETALHLTYLLFAQFPPRRQCTWGLTAASRRSPVSAPGEIIANRTLTTPESDGAKRPCALFKISNEQTHVPIAAGH